MSKILNVALPPGAPLVYANDAYPPGGITFPAAAAPEPSR